MNGLICSGGSRATSEAVDNTGKLILKRNSHLKYIRLSNLSSDYVSIAPMAATQPGECPISFGQGIVLAPKGTPGWTIEFNNTNMIYSDFWAISEKSGGNIAILVGF